MFCPRDPHVPFWKWDFLESWNLYKKKWAFFEKVTRKSNVPSPKIFFFFFFFFWKFFSFFGKDLEILNFFFFFEDLGILIFVFLDVKKKKYIYIYIHEQSTLNATWKFWIQRNIKTWNKQTNFILNHDVANQMRLRQNWVTCFFLIHLGCLRLGGLVPWLWWNGLGLHLEGMHLVNFWPLCWSCEYTFDGLKCWA